MSRLPTASPIGLFEEGLPVRLIATPRDNFVTCRPNDRVVDIVERNREDRFDFLPVELPGENKRIAGLANVAPYLRRRKPEGTIREIMRSLDEWDFIGADAGILSFIRDGEAHPFRFVVSRAGVIGLVNLSDLQKLPVRAALFAMVTHLEMVMADRIRREFGSPDAWLARVPEREGKIRKRYARAKKQGVFVEMLLLTDFADKVAIVESETAFSEANSMFNSEMEALRQLRNGLAHARDYANSAHKARQVCRIVRSMDTWIERLAKRG
jgi:CBS domain-containing protein